MKFVVALIPAAVVAVACGSTSEPAVVSSAPVSSPEPVASAPAPVNTGRIVKQVGDTAGIGEWLSWSVTDVHAASSCAGRIATPPANGEYLFVSVDVSTGPNYSDVAPQLDGRWDRTAWSVIGADGAITDAREGSLCDELDTGALSAPFDPASTYRGVFVFDVKPGAQGLVFTVADETGRRSWEWRL